MRYAGQFSKIYEYYAKARRRAPETHRAPPAQESPGEGLTAAEFNAFASHVSGKSFEDAELGPVFAVLSKTEFLSQEDLEARRSFFTWSNIVLRLWLGRPGCTASSSAYCRAFCAARVDAPAAELLFDAACSLTHGEILLPQILINAIGFQSSFLNPPAVQQGDHTFVFALSGGRTPWSDLPPLDAGLKLSPKQHATVPQTLGLYVPYS